jgi:hypothetical protein
MASQRIDRFTPKNDERRAMSACKGTQKKQAKHASGSVGICEYATGDGGMACGMKLTTEKGR